VDRRNEKRLHEKLERRLENCIIILRELGYDYGSGWNCLRIVFKRFQETIAAKDFSKLIR
jgi:hypothetical protein